jgi:starvation-inducible outer membrane lipoprotein
MKPFYVILSGLALLLSGCQSAPENSSPASAAVSSIPWNKPASWEGAGALGGFMPQGGH